MFDGSIYGAQEAAPWFLAQFPHYRERANWDMKVLIECTRFDSTSSSLFKFLHRNLSLTTYNDLYTFSIM